MGDALGSIGQGLMAVPSAVGHGALDTLGGVGTYFGGEGKDLPWNDQIGRVLVGILAGGDPVRLMKLHQTWAAQDQAKMSDPSYAAALAGPGGEDAIRKMHLPLPPKSPIELVQGGPTQSLVAVPSKPGNPTTEAYRLPQTPLQLQVQGAMDAKSMLPIDARFATTIKQGEKGIPSITLTERDITKAMVISPEQLTSRDTLVGNKPVLQAIGDGDVTVDTAQDAQGNSVYVVKPKPATIARETARGKALGQADVTVGDAAVPGGTALRMKAQDTAVDTAAKYNGLPPALQAILGASNGTVAPLGVVPSPLTGGTAAADAKLRTDEARTKAGIATDAKATQDRAKTQRAIRDDLAFNQGLVANVRKHITDKALPQKDYFPEGPLGAAQDFGYQAEQKIRATAKNTYPDLALLISQTDGILAQIARRYSGEKGVLTERDVERARNALVQPGDSQTLAHAKLDQMLTLTNEVAARRLDFGWQPDSPRVGADLAPLPERAAPESVGIDLGGGFRLRPR